MLKFHKFIAVAFALAFLILLQQFPVERPVFRILVGVVGVFLAAVTAYNFWYLKAVQKYSFWRLLAPTVFYITAFGVYGIIPWYFVKGVFLIITVVLGSLFEIFLGKFSENVVLNESLLTSFGVFMVVSAYNFYFPAFHNIYLLAVLAASFIITRSYFDFIPSTDRYKSVMSLVIGLFMVELFWALSFLPFHYSALGLLLFNAYYFCIVLTFYAVFNTLNIKKLKFHAWLLTVCTMLVLIATPWRIIN